MQLQMKSLMIQDQKLLQPSVCDTRLLLGLLVLEQQLTVGTVDGLDWVPLTMACLVRIKRFIACVHYYSTQALVHTQSTHLLPTQ